MKSKVMSDEQIQALVARLQSPAALAEAEKPTRIALRQAAARQAEIRRRSWEEAPRRVVR